jgi:hypothetical protein
MRERERTSAGSMTDTLPSGLWFAPGSAWSAVLRTDPDADTELLDRTEVRAELRADPYEDADLWDARGPGPAFSPNGLEADILTALARALGSGGMPAGSVTVHLSDLAEIRGWLGEPLWQMTSEHADTYFGRQIAWHEYPALLHQAQALARYFAFLAGPDGALVRERFDAPVYCPLDGLNWPTPVSPARHADPHPWAGPSVSGTAPDD